MTKVNNLSQTIEVPFTIFHTWTPDQMRELEALYKEGDKLTDEQMKAFVDTLPPDVQAKMTEFKVTKPWDKIVLTYTLAEFLLEAYLLGRPQVEPKAPIPARLYKKELAEVEDGLGKDELEYTPKALGYIHDALNDEDVWSKIVVKTTLLNEIAVPLNSTGALLFGEIVKAAVELTETVNVQ